MGEEWFSTIREGDSVGICLCRKDFGAPAIFEGRLIHILCYHSTAIDAIPPPCLSPKQFVSSRSVYQRKILGGWFHVIINLQPLITGKSNGLYPIGGVENASLNRVPWGRWWGGRILDLWWRKGRLFVKEIFFWTLLTYEQKNLGIMEGFPGSGRRENKTVSWLEGAFHD